MKPMLKQPLDVAADAEEVARKAAVLRTPYWSMIERGRGHERS